MGYFRNLILPLALGGVGGSVLLWNLGPQILTLVAGQPQPEAEGLLQWLGLLPPILAIGVFPSSLLLSTQNNRLFGRNLMVAAAAGVGVQLLLVPYFDARATIFSILLAEFVLVWKNVTSMKFVLASANKSVRT
jgi:O-antigen/teichoic acid export membrane protein